MCKPCVFDRINKHIRIFVQWVGIRLLILRFQYPFFSGTPGMPRKTVLNFSAWQNISTSNRPFANERRSCWHIACIYLMKNLLLWAHLMHNYIWNKTQKMRHVNGPSAITRPNAMHAFSFRQLHRDTSESLGSASSFSYSVDEMRWCEAALREWKREKTRSSWITQTVFKWLIFCVDLFTLTYMLY